MNSSNVELKPEEIELLRGKSNKSNLLAWACGRWQAEVCGRPLQNIHRRTLDSVWRQVVRYAGGNPDELLGPSHDALLSPPADGAVKQPKQPEIPPAFGPWQSCKDGINLVVNSDWIFLAYRGKISPTLPWHYCVAQVNCDEHFFELNDEDGERVEWQDCDFYMRIDTGRD